MEAAAVAVTLTPTTARLHGDTPQTTRAKTIALLRQDLINARSTGTNWPVPGTMTTPPPPTVISRNETMVRVLDGVALMVTAHRVRDIMNALRLAEEFDLRLWLDRAAEPRRCCRSRRRACR